MKRTLLLVAVFLLVLFTLNSQVVNAQVGSMMGGENTPIQLETEDSMHTESVETILQELLGQQKVTTVQELDLTEIGEDDWERLGDSVMELQHPGQAHEIMDQMMGGEGSESLRQLHINLGKSYLGYGSDYSRGMMSGGMMGSWNNTRSFNGDGSPMMGYGVGVYGLLGGLTWVALIIFLVAGTYFFIKKASKK